MDKPKSKLQYVQLKSATSMEVWLDSESLDSPPNLVVDFRYIAEKHIPMVCFNPSDGVPIDVLQEVISLTKKHAAKLDKLMTSS